MRNQLTTDELVSIYKSYKNGQDAHTFNKPVSTVYSLVKRLDKYLLNGTKRKHKNEAYGEALRILKNEVPETKTVTNSVDPYEKLNKVFTAFTDGVQEFIDYQVRHKEAKLYHDIETLKEENNQLKGIIEKGKTANWIGALRDKFA